MILVICIWYAGRSHGQLKINMKFQLSLGKLHVTAERGASYATPMRRRDSNVSYVTSYVAATHSWAYRVV